MKELIEKIKEISTKYKSYTSNEIIIHANNRGVVQGVELCLKEIDEQESKPFNPVEFGFKVEFNKDGKIEYWILEKGLNKYKIYHHRNNLFSITFENYHSEISNYLDVNVVNIIKIPNHHFGVELLRNLGVIE